MNPIRLFILRLQAFVWTAFAMSCIGLAVMVGLASLMLPYAERFRPEIESLMSERLGRPVNLDRVEASWTVLGPQLSLYGLGIGSKDDPETMLWVDMANIGYDVYGWLRPDRSGMGYFRLMSDRLELIRNTEGQWSLSGLGGAGGGGGDGALEWVLGQGGISATANEFVLVDEAKQQYLVLEQANLDFSNHDDHQHLSVRVTSPSGAGEIILEAETRLRNDGEREVTIYIKGEDLDLAGWFETFPLAGAEIVTGQADFELWADYRDESLTILGDVQADSLILAGRQGIQSENGRIETRYGLDSVTTGLNIEWRSGRELVIELNDFQIDRAGQQWPAANLYVARRLGDAKPVYAISADFVRVQDIANALVVFEILPEKLRKGLFDLAPYGELGEVRITDLKPGWPMWARGQAEIGGLSMNPYRTMPGLANITGHLTLDRFAGRFVSDSSEAFVSLPGILRHPIELDRVQGTVAWDRVEDQWLLDIPDLSFENSGVTAAGRYTMLAGDGSKPFIDLMARVDTGSIGEAHRYWPINRFQPRLVEWLDRSLIGGTVTQGVVVLYGDMDDWPFDDHQGRFEAYAEVESAELDFHPDWPPMTDLDARLHFDAHGMSADSDAATIANLPIAGIEADLPRFRAPNLSLKAEGTAPGTNLLAFLRETPINASHGRYLEGLDMDGTGSVWVNLELPFGNAPGEQRVIGHLWLEDSLISDAKWGVDFADTSGRVDFSDQGLEAVDLKTHHADYPALLSFSTGDFVVQPGQAALGQLTGVAPAAAILGEFEILRPLLDRIPGASVWEASLSVPQSDDPESEPVPRLVLQSDLQGSAMNLPPPLFKTEQDPLPISISTMLPNLASDLQIRLGEIASLDVRQDPIGGRWSGTVHFGPGLPPPNPGEGLRLDGRIEELDIDQWRDLVVELLELELDGDSNAEAEAEVGEGQNWVSGIDLTIGLTRLAGREFTNMHVVAERDADYWNLTLVGDQMEGTLRLPLAPGPNRLMLAEFERLNWKSVDRDMPAAGLQPKRIPPLRFFAKDLTFLDIQVGTTSFESYPTTNGMHIDQLETQSDVLSVSASGDWVVSGQDEESRFAATVTGEDFGRILGAFGFSQLVNGGQTVIKLDAGWKGAPSEFELAILGGDLDIYIGRGEMTEVGPGAGRIFGLLSLTQIPRRLRLDFADLFKSGMVFDSIEGKFLMEAGDAYTDNLLIASPTAEVQIRGRTGLAQQDYNQIITVVPKLSDTLPLVGALAGGGAGAAALLVFRGLFGGQIERITQYHYAVTGSWDDPTIDLLGANDGKISMDLPETIPEG